MTRNKDRLQLALYARPKHPPGNYHYAFFVAPKNAQGPLVKHHVKNTLQVNDSGKAIQPWRYERTIVADVKAEPRLLARIIIAKVAKSSGEVQRILDCVPIYQVEDLDKAEALGYLDRKRAQGRWDTTWKGASGTPLIDLLEGKEIFE
jgi:hypothetical protein